MGSLPRKFSVEVAKRWLALAEQRRAHLTELYDTGRWQHYYTEAELIERMREAIMLEETWAKLAYPDGMPATETAKEPDPIPEDEFLVELEKLRA
jgi:uncharacterized repeat protein (TIGR03809 family)